MATPYIKNDGVNFRVQAGLPSAGVNTLQFTDSAASHTQTIPAATGTLALTTIATGVNALATTDMAAGFRMLDGLVMPNVVGYLTNAPPVSPSDGSCYIIGAAPTGAWAGQGGKVTRYSTVATAWEFFTPKNGWMLQANSARESYRYTAGAWEIYYQEGTWTPTLSGSTTPGTQTYVTQQGQYTRMGNRIFLNFFIDISAKDAGIAGNATIQGLPIVVGTGSFGVINVAYLNGFTFPAGSTQVGGYASSGSSIIYFEAYGSGIARQQIPVANVSATAKIIGNAYYLI